MQSYTALNVKFFNIKLFDTCADIDLLIPFFYEYVHSESNINTAVIAPLANCNDTLLDVPTDVQLQPLVTNVCLDECKQDSIFTYCDKPVTDKPVTDKPVVPFTPLKVYNGPPSGIPLGQQCKHKWFDPKQKDTLFWCIFTAVFGVSEYMLIGTKYANREWEEKQNAILEFQKSSALLRTTNHKITLGKVQEIMSEYMTNQSSITLLGIVGLAVHYKHQIYLVDSVKKTHLVYTPESYTNTCYIYRHDTFKNKFRLALDPVSLDDSFCLESFTRPLRAISSYKLGELVDLANRFHILHDEKPKKEDIYRKVSEFVVWL